MKNGHFKMSKNGFSNFRISKKLQKSSDESIMLLFKLQKKSFCYCKIFKYFLKRTCAYFMCCNRCIFSNQNMQKNMHEFYCKKCDYSCKRKFLWEQHSQPKA